MIRIDVRQYRYVHVGFSLGPGWQYAYEAAYNAKPRVTIKVPTKWLLMKQGEPK